MSLLGRLEDLSLTDIVQIVFLSRRTGVLEIVNGSGRHTVLFRHGLIVNASSPDQPDLILFLHTRGLVPLEHVKTIRQMEEKGVPAGTAVVELNLLTKEQLADAVRDRVLSVVAPLLTAREGEFNFLLSETMRPIDVEYDPDALFPEGGFLPQKIMGAAEGEKIKPLQGLEESLRVGKALLRSEPVPVQTAPPLNLGLGQPKNVVSFPGAPGTPSRDARSPVPSFPSAGEPGSRDRAPMNLDDLEPGEATLPAGTQASQFRVAGGLFDVESPEAAFRNVMLLERNPMIRVAAKRAFGRKGIKIFQFGSVDEVRNATVELFRGNSFFVTFLELTEDDSAGQLLQQIKRRNPRLPVVVIDHEADLRRRQDLLKMGADLYLTKPSPARLQPEVADQELTLYAEELVLFAERSFAQWEQVRGGLGPEAGRKFYAEAEKENVDRSFGILKQLINELSNPNDITEVGSMILRLTSQYLDRGVLFMLTDTEFRAVDGFGATGGSDEMNARVEGFRIGRNEPSILADVLAERETHRGKMRRTSANELLVKRLGTLMPSEVVALPIIHEDKIVGVLYGDNAEHRARIDSVSGLETFVSHASYAFGNAVNAQNRSQRRDGQ
jgi:CheY-like chemotaxis protein